MRETKIEKLKNCEDDLEQKLKDEKEKTKYSKKFFVSKTEESIQYREHYDSILEGQQKRLKMKSSKMDKQLQVYVDEYDNLEQILKNRVLTFGLCERDIEKEEARQEKIRLLFKEAEQVRIAKEKADEKKRRDEQYALEAK